MDGHEIVDEQTLRFRIATYQIGTKVEFKIFRDDKEIVTTINLMAPPENIEKDITKISGKNPISGASVANLSPALSDEIGLSADSEGVVVLEVEEGSIAERFGIVKGDIIVNVNKTQIKNVDQLVKLIDENRTGVWNISIKRGDEVLNITIRGQ